MNPIVHGELSWLVGHWLPQRRDRLLITLAGLSPDLDGLTLLAGEEAYGRWHHVLTHGALAAVMLSATLSLFATRRAVVFGLCLAAFHLHLLCDLAGSGPGWPLSYLWPFSAQEWAWEGQWNLASWQNTLIGLASTLGCLGAALWVSRTPLELVSQSAESAVVKALRVRFLHR